MIALTLGAFLTLGVGGLLLAQSRSVALEYAVSDVQQRGRFALARLREDLHRAGFAGCSTGIGTPMALQSGADSVASAVQRSAVRAYSRTAKGTWEDTDASDADLAWTRVLRSERQRGARYGSQVLHLRIGYALHSADGVPRLIERPVPAGADRVFISDNPECAVKQHHRVALADCSGSVHAFQVSNPISCNSSRNSNPALLKMGVSAQMQAFSASYDVDAEVIVVDDVVWFVGESGIDSSSNPPSNGDARPVWALYRDSRNDRRGPQEVVAGVEYLRLGLVSGRTPSAVDAVEVSLLLASMNEVLDAEDQNQYVLNDTRVVPPGVTTPPGIQHGGGRKLRQVATRTVLLRNAGGAW